MAKLTARAIEVAREQATRAILDNGYTTTAYICRWGKSSHCSFFFAPDDEAAEAGRASRQRSEGTKLVIVGKVTPEEARQGRMAANAGAI